MRRVQFTPIPRIFQIGPKEGDGLPSQFRRPESQSSPLLSSLWGGKSAKASTTASQQALRAASSRHVLIASNLSTGRRESQQERQTWHSAESSRDRPDSRSIRQSQIRHRHNAELSILPIFPDYLSNSKQRISPLQPSGRLQCGPGSARVTCR